MDPLQLDLRKKNISFKFKFLCRQYHLHPNRNSLRMVPRFHHCVRTLVQSPIKKSNNGLPCARKYEFISWKPVLLKSPIDFNHPILLIKLIRITGFHHLQLENTQAQRVDNAPCLKIANK
jgi:hypothetical protein